MDKDIRQALGLVSNLALELNQTTPLFLVRFLLPIFNDGENYGWFINTAN